MHEEKINYDESAVPGYTLPDPLVLIGGASVESAEVWREFRRPEILRLFEDYVYGKIPGRLDTVTSELTSVDSGVERLPPAKKCPSLRGCVTRRIDLLLYLPNDRSGPVPVFVGLNFRGNITVCSDRGITATDQRIAYARESGHLAGRSLEALRGSAASRWCVDKVIKRGYGLATACYCDIDPDFDDGFQNGVHPLFYRRIKSGRQPMNGSIGAGPGTQQNHGLPEMMLTSTIAGWRWGYQTAPGQVLSISGSRDIVVRSMRRSGSVETLV